MSAIVVTGATGQVGGALLEELVRRGAHTRAMARTEKQATELIGCGVEPVVADLERPETLPAALEGVDRAFLVPRDAPNQPEMEAAFVEAAVRAEVERIVELSANSARLDNPVALMRWHARSERTLEGSGLGHVVLRPQLYMQNLLRFGPSVAAEERFSAPMGDRRFALVDVRDVARVAATILNQESVAGRPTS